MQIVKKIFSFLWRTGISIVFLFILFKKIDWRSTFKVIARAEPVYLILAGLTFLIIYTVVFCRWKMLLDAQGIILPVKRVLSSFSGGLFFNLFFPSTIGGDIARSADLSLHTKRAKPIMASVLLDRLSGFVGLSIVALASLIAGRRLIDDPWVYRSVFIVTGLLAAILLVIFSERICRRINRSAIKEGGWKDKIRELHAELYFFRSKPVTLAMNVACSIVIQAGVSFVSYFLLAALGVKINIVYLLIFNPLITLITTIPISIGGLGLRDASSVFFYAKAGVVKDVALAQSLLNFGLIVGFGLIAGVIYGATLHYRRIQPHQAAVSAHQQVNPGPFRPQRVKP